MMTLTTTPTTMRAAPTMRARACPFRGSAMARAIASARARSLGSEHSVHPETASSRSSASARAMRARENRRAGRTHGLSSRDETLGVVAGAVVARMVAKVEL